MTESTKTEKRIYVTDILKPKDLLEHRCTLLISGTGSRKTTLINQMGESGLYNIMVITSRKSMYKETLATHGNIYSGSIDRDCNVWMPDKWDYYFYQKGYIPEAYEQYHAGGNRLKQSAVTIPKYLTNELVDSATTYEINNVWQDHDLLVVDEVHSLLTDATFMPDMARLWSMIKHISSRCKHLVLMTATPEEIMPLLMKELPDLHVIDLRSKTYSIRPEKVRFMPEKYLQDELELLYLLDEKWIWFSNRKIVLQDFCDATGLNPEDGISLSTDKQWISNLSKKERIRIKGVMQYLTKHRRFPDCIKFVIATSFLREGVSITNEDYMHVFVDSHRRSDVVQYAGRLRSAEYTLTFIDDAYQFVPYDDAEDLLASDTAKLDDINQALYEIDPDDQDAIKGLVKRVEARYLKDPNSNLWTIPNAEYRPYIYYNPFSCKFEINELKLLAEQAQLRSAGAWNRLDRCKKTSFSSYVRDWFPGGTLKIEPYETPEWKSREYMRKNGFAKGRYYGEQTIETLRAKLAAIWEDDKKNVNTYLQRFCKLKFARVRSGKHKDKWTLSDAS